ncbi:MAG TPA: ankyrin repeat domain-containing protein, partial [Steroidobacteraceae bacterium]
RTPLYVAVDMNSYKGRAFSFAAASGFAGYPGATAAHPKSTATAMEVENRLIAMGVDTNHELTRMRPNGNGRGRFEDYMMRGGTGPLMIATLSYDDASIKTLLAHGADVNAPNVFQITPLMAAAGMSGSGRGGGGGGGGGPRGGDAQDRVMATIDILLAAGATLNERVLNSHTHTAKLTAYVQGRDHEGQTALFAAAEAGWDKVVKHLLERGADATIVDASGKTALDYARAPPKVGPGGAPPGGSTAASRAATIALLEPLVAKPAVAAPDAAAGAAP